MRALLSTFSWQELRHHPWRSAAAVVAVMLGVALAFSVHLINASALSEFAGAVRSVNGQPDLTLRAVQGRLDETLFAQVASRPQVAAASPVLELESFALLDGGRRLPLRVMGIDALVAAPMAPALMPVPANGAGRFALFAPDTVFLNPAAQQALGGATAFRLQSGLSGRPVQVAGTVGAPGAPLAVMDIGALQDLFGLGGRLSRIDLRLRPGTDPAQFIRSLALPAGVTVAEPGDAAQRVSSLSRAYRVNLTVLALVALFTGAFLVFSVLSLSLAKRAQQFALLGVLGLTARERLRLVLAESLALGLAGSLAGIALGTALASLALRLLGGDLGGGYFSGVAPVLQWDAAAALAYAALGVLAALVGGWWPARAAGRLPLAQTLKGQGLPATGRRAGWIGLILIASGALLARTPPLLGIPLAAYVSVGLLLVGGIIALPWAVSLVYEAGHPLAARHLLALLAVERARRVRESAAVAVSGVVASLSLAVALTVMVASFRDSVAHWLDVVLPADLYVRTAASAGAGDSAYFTPDFVQAVARLDGVQRVGTLRASPLQLDPARPPVMLVARPIDDPARALPLVGAPLPVPPGQVAIYVSEAMVDLYGARPGTVFTRLSGSFRPDVQDGRSFDATFFVAGVWRDYARQFGAIALDRRDFERLTGDTRVNDLALWLAAGADVARLQEAIRGIAQQQSGAAGLIEFASVGQLRAASLRIFDRSFAVTYWLQAVAIAIGLFGVAASFSAQVLARRKEFGLLAHLGLTRRQILAVVAGEGAAWTAIGSIAGLALGLAVSLVLVHVVNPQSFHWTMDLAVPWLRLLALCTAVMAAGTATAWLAGRAAAGRDAVLAVKEDW
ncbi:FtsX-like permease family protein [Variovorax terrae]|uniref:ABC transporter permease n=1 Tax=Variovorax terrae TaxID=2923278 RepID=A0A9X2ALR7_9BURK|nr:ABC transporter permease [Variovorax terrae]MCJ0762589.1 ABC transporter permease [Variovorax terrae]